MSETKEIPIRVNPRVSTAWKPAPGKQEDVRKFRNSRAWRSARQRYMKKNPLCVLCKKEGVIQEVQSVHHIEAVIKRWDLRLVPSNFASLCMGCHSKIELQERRGRPTQHLFLNGAGV